MQKQPRVRSVGLLLLNNEGNFYGLRELKAKPEIGKVPGIKDYSFPWETMEEGESETATLKRLLFEEVATCEICISQPLKIIQEVWVYDTVASIYLARFISGPKNMRGAYAGEEVEPLGWVTRPVLLSRCRDGVRDVIDAFDALGEVRLVA